MEQRLTPLPLTCTQFPVYIVGKWWRSRRHHLLKILLYFAPLYGVYTKFGTDPDFGYFPTTHFLTFPVLQIFSALYPLCHKGLRDFCGYHCCKFLKPTPSEMLHALSRWFVFPCFDDHNACKHARSYPQYCGQQDTAPL